MFSTLSPKISVPLFYGYITLITIYKFLFGNLFGIFLLSVFIYHNCFELLNVTPYNFEELMSWLVSQSESTKNTILGSLITIIGFLLAYASATANWKSQMLANIKLQASGEIESFFTECSKLSVDCEIYASALVEAVNKIQKNCSVDDAIFLANYNREQGQKFISNRQRLIALGIDVHSLSGKYGILLLSAPNLKHSLNNAIKALENINDKLWINVPFYLKDDQNPIQTFINQVNVPDCIALKHSVTLNHPELNFSAGSVRGNLMSSVVGLNFWTVFNLFKDRKSFFEAIESRRNNKLKGS